MKDIENKADIETLIQTFYSSLLQVDEMKPAFEGLNFQDHVPRIVAFWSMVLLDEEGYKTNVFDKHLHLPIQPHHFDIWKDTFVATVNQLFMGEKAELAIQRATVLSYTFKSKWEHLKK
ncbi:MAG: group III truncated hemoglobin [Bacteroidia bacterium]|nr:group III truncated hemoglobin [Bacteroidia bacterium]